MKKNLSQGRETWTISQSSQTAHEVKQHHLGIWRFHEKGIYNYENAMEENVEALKTISLEVPSILTICTEKFYEESSIFKEPE